VQLEKVSLGDPALFSVIEHVVENGVDDTGYPKYQAGIALHAVQNKQTTVADLAFRAVRF
jgi:hypothetical protein